MRPKPMLPWLACASLCGVFGGCLLKSSSTAPTLAPRPEDSASLVALPLPSKPPEGATVLFDGKQDSVQQHWLQRYSENPAKWTADSDGVLSPKGGDMSSKAEFGDCYLHLEFRTPVDANGKPVGHGNSGVGLQGRYEIQIMDSHGGQPEKTGCGSFYSQKPPTVNVSKKGGEWQSFDIIFRAPRLDGGGQVVEKPRATVFQNGVLIHNNNEFLGMTGIQYGQYKAMAKTGPIVIQGDHDPVQYRNIWVVPMG